MIKILDRQQKATHEIRFIDKTTNKSITTSLICENETKESLKEKVDKVLVE